VGELSNALNFLFKVVDQSSCRSRRVQVLPLEEGPIIVGTNYYAPEVTRISDLEAEGFIRLFNPPLNGSNSPIIL